MPSSLQVHLEVTCVRSYVAQSGHGSDEVSTLELHCLEMGAHSRLQRGRDHKQNKHNFQTYVRFGRHRSESFVLFVFVWFL